MNRVACDNALLASCDELCSKFVRVAGVALLGMGIGAVWFLIVAEHAGAL